MAAIAAAIRTFRSHVEVAITNTDELEAEVERFGPQLVICSSPIPSNPVDPQLIASIELSPDPDQPSRFRVGERHWEPTNPMLGETLSAVDETNLVYMASREKEPTNTDEAEA
jgi:CRP/FNR family transcriptional regulator, cyclic AMP receptor protein